MSLSRNFSDGLPVQFWLTGDLSFNTKPNNYMQDICFHQRRSCDKEVRLRFRESSRRNYKLKAFGEDGTVLMDIPFTREDPLSLDSLSAFTNHGAGTDWVLSDSPFCPLAAGSTKELLGVLSGAEAATDYNFSYLINTFGIGANGVIHIQLMDASFTVLQESVSGFGSGSVDNSGSIALNGGVGVPAYVAIVVELIAGTADITVISFDLDTEGTGLYIYEAVFIPSDEGMCDKMVQLKIYTGSVDLPGFEDWEAEVGVWAIDATPSTTVPALFAHVIHKTNLDSMAIGMNKFNYDVNLTGAGIATVNLTFTKDGVVVGTASSGNLNGAGNYTGVFEVDITDIPDKVQVGVGNFTLAAKDFVMNSLELDIAAETEEAYSDFLEFLTILSDILIQWKSVSDAFNIPYNGENPYFNMQVDAQFYKERNPTEEKIIRLSDRIISTASSLSTERYFRLVNEGVPDYLIKKLNLVFQHGVSGSVLIDGLEWKKGDELKEIRGDRPEDFPLSQAETWLIQKNSVQDNAN